MVVEVMVKMVLDERVVAEKEKYFDGSRSRRLRAPSIHHPGYLLTMNDVTMRATKYKKSIQDFITTESLDLTTRGNYILI